MDNIIYIPFAVYSGFQEADMVHLQKNCPCKSTISSHGTKENPCSGWIQLKFYDPSLVYETDRWSSKHRPINEILDAY